VVWLGLSSIESLEKQVELVKPCAIVDAEQVQARGLWIEAPRQEIIPYARRSGIDAPFPQPDGSGINPELGLQHCRELCETSFLVGLIPSCQVDP